MAILKIEKHEQYTLNGMIEYLRDTKIHGEQVCYFGSIYASPNKPLIDMMNVKMLWNKVGGTQYRQIVLSLTEDESCVEYYNAFISVSWNVAMAIANYFKCQVVFAIHTNTDNIHTHFVLNSVCFTDGKKIQISKNDTEKLKAMINEFLNEFGFKNVYYYKFKNDYDIYEKEASGSWYDA